ncbi:hypothetical protein NQ317_012950 [Molorchus minor]|uniref:POPDC1-3 domain-containing protein n=1 Tax=Molorchus minor TaxID=1323400 RepID=A0ABQ9JMV6_9CUCU|nr:hypothetical protein NQ317_012950 [Molorchus minor]
MREEKNYKFINDLQEEDEEEVIYKYRTRGLRPKLYRKIQGNEWKLRCKCSSAKHLYDLFSEVINKKVFKPLRVSKKHFKELVREAKVMNLEKGDIYAVEDVSPADERLSVLLKGRLRVTCDDTHLHFINMHQFVDSPEWEANHEQSDDVFQVTITAEEDSVYLCWPRMKLERVLRHRPMLKVVLDCIIGKDITQKLYALNEHLSGLSDEREEQAESLGKSAEPQLVRGCSEYRYHRAVGSLGKIEQQRWVPLVAKQFPAKSPFIPQNSSASLRLPEVHVSPQRTRSLRRSNREVKFETTRT